MSQKLKVDDLIAHKKNDFFFDDIKGDAWTEFVESIKTSGVIEPIVVTQNKVIVSGHQRVRACKLLGIEEIDAEVKIFDSDDEIIKCLIETNIRQRGIGNTNPVKFGRCLKELERIYGIQHGATGFQGNQYSEVNPQNAETPQITQEDLASQLGMSVDTLKRYKDLADSIPEIQSLVETGIVTPTTARAIMKKLPEFQQKELAEQFAEKGSKVSGREAEEEIKRLKTRIDDLVASKSQRETFEKNRADRLQKENENLKAELAQIEPEKVEVEVFPDGYEETTSELKALKQQMITNAKLELADFVTKYSDMVDIKAMFMEYIDKYL